MILKGFLFFGLFILRIGCFSQVDSNAAPIVVVDIPDVPESLKPLEIDLKKTEIYDVVEVSPEYPGGMQKLYDFLGKNIIYPEEAMEKGYQGKVYIQFIINEDGCISDFRVIKGYFQCLNEEAIRVLQLMPDWTPGEIKGVCVKTRYLIPINFMVDNNLKSNKKKKRKK